MESTVFLKSFSPVQFTNRLDLEEAKRFKKEFNYESSHYKFVVKEVISRKTCKASHLRRLCSQNAEQYTVNK